MKKAKQKKLRAAGWRIGSVDDFLNEKIVLNKNPFEVAKEALADKVEATKQRQWRALVREHVLADAVLADRIVKRKLRSEVKQLRAALIEACDLAIDSADVIDNEGIVIDTEDSADFRRLIARLRALTDAPKAERHVEREQQRAAAKAARRKRTTTSDDLATVDERPKKDVICDCGSGQLTGDDGDCNDCRPWTPDEGDPLHQQYRDDCKDKDRA